MAEVNLPEGWVLTPIDDAISSDGLISDGDWVESKDQDPSGSVRLIQLADIGDGEFKNKSDRFMTEESAASLNCTYLHSGDILVARMPDPLGRACIFPGVGQQSVTVVDICLIRTGDKSAVSNKLLTYWINSPDMRGLIADNASGTTRKRITRKKLEKFEIPLPPLAEQKVIAEKLDTLLAQVDNTKARLEHIPEILKRFRQSVLAAAVSGKLTEEWRGRNTISFLSNNLFENLYQIPEEFPSYDIPDTWCKSPIGNFCTFQQGMQIAKSTRYQAPVANRLPILRIGNYSDGFTSDVDYVEVDDNSLVANEADLILTRTGETRGRVLTGFKGVFHNNTFRINFNKKIILREYLLHALNDIRTQNYILDVSGRSAQPDLTHKKFGPCPISIPPIEEQTEIVRRVEELFAFADRIEQAAKAALSRVNNLTQSILAKAFRGELTADWRAANPELISGDNSAEALLARIKAERAKLKLTKKAKA